METLPGDLMKIPEVLRVLGVSRPTLRRICARGELELVRVGQTYRIRRSELEAYVSTGAEPDDAA